MDATSLDLLTERETADMLRIKPETLTTWRHKGEGPKYVRVGRRTVRYPREQIFQFVLASLNKA